jgi:hypothetical protein
MFGGLIAMARRQKMLKRADSLKGWRRLRKTFHLKNLLISDANAPEITRFHRSRGLERHSLDHMIVFGGAHLRRIVTHEVARPHGENQMEEFLEWRKSARSVAAGGFSTKVTRIGSQIWEMGMY